jgi:hypothetical protein
MSARQMQNVQTRMAPTHANVNKDTMETDLTVLMSTNVPHPNMNATLTPIVEMKLVLTLANVKMVILAMAKHVRISMNVTARAHVH